MAEISGEYPGRPKMQLRRTIYPTGNSTGAPRGRLVEKKSVDCISDEQTETPQKRSGASTEELNRWQQTLSTFKKEALQGRP